MLCPVVILGVLGAAAPEGDASGIEFFEKRIRPVLVDSCYRCHGPKAEKPKGGLRLDTREGILRGGGRGPAIVPGSPGKSLLIRALRHEDAKVKMPPTRKLPGEVIADFSAWVEMGAPGPRGEGAAGAAGGAKGVLDRSLARSFWSFKPPVDPPVPEVRRKGWPAGDVDRFILAKLEEKGLEPAPAADRGVLIRRASYDLTGLPPSAEEVEAFERDASPGAFERVVERLLASPRFGERWGRHWLDVARYADTKGYVYSDREEGKFVHAHVYRDWVIRAFNQDLPYDRFLMLQLAADRLVDEGGDPRDLAALGFLTVGRRLLGNIHDIIDDRIDTAMRGMQGLTVGCARCHDHKYDPIPTRDYYSLYGVFAGSMEKLVCLDSAPRSTPEHAAYEKGLRERQEKLAKAFEAKRDDMNARFRAKAGEYLAAVLQVESLPTEEFYAFRTADDLNPVVVRQWQAYLFGAGKGFHPVFAPWHALEKLPEGQFGARVPEVLESLASARDPARRVNPLVLEALVRPPPASMKDVARRYGKVLARVNARAALPDPAEEELRQVLFAPDTPATVPPGPISEIEWFFDEGTRVELGKLQAEIERWIIASSAAPPHAVILADRSVLRSPRVFIRGNPANRGEEVPRRYLEALEGEGRKPFETGSGRLELARSIARKENPLTARVMVNRIWHHLFGAGLVRTPSDFGTRSDPPSHRELLDHLAARFVEEGWSVKRMIRRLMLSRVYEQRSEASPEKLKLDPENRLLARMERKRLDLESMRDSMLWASGELVLDMGGRPVDLTARPPAPRRTVYGFIDRQFLPGFFRVFDFANPDQHSPERHFTTVPQQALYLMNSPFVVERARALAARPEVAGAEDPGARVRRLYRLVFAREPAAGEVDHALGFIRGSPPERPRPEPPPPPVWRYGYGEFDEGSARVKSFELLPHFSGEAWQGGPAWPDPKLGWVQLKADGGHAGNDLAHAAIRRWVAPRAMALSIAGKVRHAHQEGDGVRARIVSSRAGLLWKAEVHNQSADAAVAEARVEPGDSIDFAVDFRGGLNSDDFTWAPVVREAVAGGGGEWDAKREFAGPPGPPVEPLGPWELYAQALLLSNEFLFVD